MKFTNKYNLPAPLFKALITDTYRGDSDTWSVTTLINAPKQVQLKKRHGDEVTIDASDNLWSLLGSSAHKVMELATGEEDFAEVRLRMPLKGGEVSGMTDRFSQSEKCLDDFKVTGTYAFLLEGKNYAVIKEKMIDEAGPWTAQINLNVMLYRYNGFKVEKGRIIAILRDWNRSKSMQDPKYPQAAFHVVDIPLWTQHQAEAYAQKRLSLHLAAEKIKNDDNIPHCSPDERWMRPEAWAVKKEGNKRASKVFNNEKGATIYVGSKNKDEHDALVKAQSKGKTYKKINYVVEYRRGRNMRCELFCPVNSFCNFYREQVKPYLEGNESEEE